MNRVEEIVNAERVLPREYRQPKPAAQTQARFFEGDLLRVGHREQFNADEAKSLIQFINREHYLGYPFNKDGTPNPYQYCYGMGYISRSDGLWAGFVAGFYPNEGFWKKHFPVLHSTKGMSWLSRHAANIYRVVAFYPEDASALLSQYEEWCKKDGRTCILFSLPTRAEKDAVCNFEWFKKNGFKDYGWTEGSKAKVFAKVLGFEPTKGLSEPIERQTEGGAE